MGAQPPQPRRDGARRPVAVLPQLGESVHGNRRIGPTTRTEYIRDVYWNGGPTLDVYKVEDYDDSIDDEPEVVNRLLGYEESFRPRGFWRVGDDRPTDRVVRRFGI